VSLALLGIIVLRSTEHLMALSLSQSEDASAHLVMTEAVEALDVKTGMSLHVFLWIAANASSTASIVHLSY